MFTTIQSRAASTVSITVEGIQQKVPKGLSVAAVILGHAGHKDCRCSFISGERRAPYCFIGVCHECLMEINGKPNQQACLIQVQEGMNIKRQQIREGE